MKTFTAIIIALLLLTWDNSQSQTQSVTVTISPYNGGFNVYSESGELLLEFLPQDSAEVATLEYIHGATIDFQANPDHWRDPQPDSLPETNPNARNIKHLSSVNNKTFSPKVVSLKNEIRNSYKDVWQK